ncbi:hypothetical protein [Endozoicomonas euniceicola]|uniref:Uncharacterized protein n=1 Tax=Endozoicomonas euniceicola TaxID=1234143 RepID=A0ABY6GY48_9GAMM|nr:hypothetical protein [Endozoicomonas euniceicola]UYM17707.1 hypothetical protein NX720_07310 [Endozoicomonas euniceicola]
MKVINQFLIALVVVPLSFFPKNLYASDQYFWLARILPNLRTIATALVRVSPQHLQSVASLQARAFYLNGMQTASRSPGSVGRVLGINDLVRQDWSVLPQQNIDINSETGRTSSDYFTPQQPVGHFSTSLADSLFSIIGSNFPHQPLLFGAGAHSVPFSTLLSTRPLFDQPRVLEFTPPGTNHPIIVGLQPLTDNSARLRPRSSLAEAIEHALPSRAESSNQAATNNRHALLSNLLMQLSTGGTSGGTSGLLYFSRPHGAYLHWPNHGQHLSVLVPHDTVIRLGLINGATGDNTKHLEPDHWGEPD